MEPTLRTNRFRFWLWLIAFIGVIVPRRLRAEWRQEWEAEMQYRETLLASWDKLNWKTKLDLFRRSLGAFRDALWMQQLRWEDEMIQDVRYGLRILRKQPGFTLIAVLSLALGIGANTAIFSLLDVVLLKSLPVQQPERLVLFGKGQASGQTDGLPDRSWDLFSYPFYQQTREHNEVFADVAALLSIPWTVHGYINMNGASGPNGLSAEPEKLEVQLVSGTYFSVLGVNASLGRVVSEADDENVGAHPVAVVSHSFWERRLGGEASAVGQTVTIDKVAYTIIGVAPRDFFGTTVGEAPDLWVPLAMESQLPPAHWNGRNDKLFQSLYLIGRLKDGVEAPQANAAMNLLFKQFLQDEVGAQPTADQLQDIERASVELTPAGRGLSQLRREFSPSLRILMVVVGLVLLIACANVANLLLARATARQKEFAVRLALGATRLRLVRQLLTEGMLLATLGGVAGVVLATWGSRLLVVMASTGSEPLPLDVTLDGRVLMFTVLTSLLSAVVFGTAPALRASRLELNSILKGGRGVAQNTTRSFLGKSLVTAQVALSLLLLVGAGLFLRTLINLQSLPTGFNPQNVVLFQIDSTAAGYKGPQLSNLMREVEDKVETIPGIEAAAFSFFIFNQGQWSGPAFTRGPDLAEGQSRNVRNNVVGTDYFKAMGIPLVLGRGFGPQDTSKSPKVAVVTEAMVQRFFPDSSPIGQHFGINGPASLDEIEIIGVVKNSKYGSLKEAWRPMAYYPHTQRGDPLSNFVVKFSSRPEMVIPAVRTAIREVNGSLPIDEVVSLSEHIGRSLVQQKLVARLAAFFGLLALLLACVGLYGVMSYAVARRTNEIGIRMALGARSTQVLWLVLREALTLVLIGVAIGWLTSLAATRAASSLLFGLEPNDPLTMVAATLLLLTIALLAAYLPARRASHVDPMVALRNE